MDHKLYKSFYNYAMIQKNCGSTYVEQDWNLPMWRRTGTYLCGARLEPTHSWEVPWRQSWEVPWWQSWEVACGKIAAEELCTKLLWKDYVMTPVFVNTTLTIIIADHHNRRPS